MWVARVKNKGLALSGSYGLDCCGFASKLILGGSGIRFFLAYMVIGLFVFACVRFRVSFYLLEVLGKNSYAIYLSHFLVIGLLHGLFPGIVGVSTLLYAFLVTILLSYICSVISYNLVESKVAAYVHKVTR